MTNHWSWRGVAAKFQITTPEPHDIEAFHSVWTGVEMYRVDGIKCWRHSGWVAWYDARFEIPNTGCFLEIRVRTILSWRVYLDGALVVRHLFPTLRTFHLVLSGVLVLLGMR